MKIKPYIDRLNASPVYKQFLEKNKDAFMIAGFFIIDFELGQNIHQIDFYMPSENKVAAFTLDKDITIQTMELMDKKVPEKITPENNIDLDELKGILEDEMKNRGISEQVKKMIAVFQTIDGKKIWNVNCILSGMDVVKAHVEDSSKTILKLDKISVMEIMRKMPQTKIAMPEKEGKELQGDSKKKKLEQIKKLEEVIEKEKERIEKESKDNKGEKESEEE